MRTRNKIAVVVFLCLCGALIVAPAASVHAITVITGDNSLFPGMADVIVATPDQTSFHDNGTDSLSQTFQVTSGFDLQSIFVVFGTPGDLDVGLQIFNVSDVASTTLPVSPSAGDLVLDTMFMAPSANDNTVMQIALDSPLTLAATAGSAGYAIRFSHPDFSWDRTTASFGSVYDFGQAYENSMEKADPRDFSLALSTEGPPDPPDVILSVASGLITDGSTWDGGAVPSAGNAYHVVNGHAVTADGTAAFIGDLLRIENGSLTYTASSVDIPSVEVAEGNTVSETTTGDFFLGDLFAPVIRPFDHNGEMTIDAENGGEVGLDVALRGTGKITVNGTPGTRLFVGSAIDGMAGFNGTLQFNGSGDELLYEGPTGSGVTLEMNSTSTNRLALSAASFGGLSEKIIFNQEGEIDHRSDGASGANNRLMAIVSLTANADITIDLTKTYDRSGTPNERRLFASNGWHGAGNMTVNGTPTDPTTGSATLNEFESGSTSPDGPNDTHLTTFDYSGTVTANDFINVEIRDDMPAAAAIVNQNARLEFGHRDVESLFTTRMGNIVVNNGGILEVGYEEDELRAPYRLRLTTQRGRGGNLTLNDGSTTLLQISGTDPNKFDQIVAEGTVTLDGTLEVLFNPDVPAQTVICENMACEYAPTAGDTFDLIVIGAETLTADYDGNGTVGLEDYDIWVETFGSVTDLTADGNGNGIVDAADFTVWRDNLGATGSLTGMIDTNTNFDNIVIMDPDGLLTGFDVSVDITSAAVTLTVNSVAVPEPASFVIAVVAGALGLATLRRRRKRCRDL